VPIDEEVDEELAAIGGALAIAVGAAILDVAPSLVPEGVLPAAVTLSFDLRVVGFCAAAALAVGLLFGLAPAWQATGLSAARAINADTRTTTGRGGRLRGLLVAGEVASAVLLLFGAGLLLRTLIAVDDGPRLSRRTRAHDDGRSARRRVSVASRPRAVLRGHRSGARGDPRHAERRLGQHAADGRLGPRGRVLAKRVGVIGLLPF
jgi:hypothetical protein